MLSFMRHTFSCYSNNNEKVLESLYVIFPKLSQKDGNGYPLFIGLPCPVRNVADFLVEVQIYLVQY